MSTRLGAIHFTVLGTPDLNNVENTKIIIAGVTWSLPYEWFFYFSLPLLALFVRVIPSVSYLAIGIVSVVLLILWGPNIYNLLPFLGGIAASFLVRLDGFCRFSARSETSFLLVGIIAFVVIVYPSVNSVIPILMLSLVFSLIAGGNTMFKVLVSPLSCAFGEMAYSIYLLHGIILFTLFTFIIGLNDAKALSPISHWLLIICVSPILVTLSFCTFRIIERPAMRSVNPIIFWLRSKLLNSNNFKF